MCCRRSRRSTSYYLIIYIYVLQALKATYKTSDDASFTIRLVDTTTIEEFGAKARLTHQSSVPGLLDLEMTNGTYSPQAL